MSLILCLYSHFQGATGPRSGILRASNPPSVARGPLSSALPPPPPPSEDEVVMPFAGSVNLGAVGNRPGTFCYIFPTVCMMFSISGVSAGGQVSGVQGELMFDHPPPGFGDLPPGWSVRLEPRGSLPEPHSDHLIQSEIVDRLHRAQGSLQHLNLGYS